MVEVRFFFEFLLFNSDNCWRIGAKYAKVALRTEGVVEAAAAVYAALVGISA